MKSLELRAALCCLVSGGLGRVRFSPRFLRAPAPVHLVLVLGGALVTRYGLCFLPRDPLGPGVAMGSCLLPNRSSKRAAIG